MSRAALRDARRRDRETVMLGRRCPNCRSSIVVITRAHLTALLLVPCPVCGLLREGGADGRLELRVDGLVPDEPAES